MTILSYGLVFNLSALILNHWVIGYVISAIGPYKTIALSNVGLILFAFGLGILPINPLYLYGLAILQALSFEAYFLAQHIYLAETAAKSETGKRVGRQFSVEPIGYMIGPPLAGLIAWLWSAQAVNFVAGAILVASGIFALAFHSRQTQAKHYYSHPKIWQIYRRFLSEWRNPLLVGGVISFDFIYQMFTSMSGFLS